MCDDEGNKVEYIKALIDNLKSQKSYMLLYVSFDLAVIGLALKNFMGMSDPPAYSVCEKIIIGVGFSSLTLSAIFCFIWLTLLHRLSIEAVDLFITLDVESARQTHYPGNEYYSKNGWLNWWGQVFLIIGIALSVAFIWLRIL